MNEEQTYEMKEWVVQYWEKGGWHNSGSAPGVHTFTIAARLARNRGDFARSLVHPLRGIEAYRIYNNRTLDSIPEAIL